MEERRARMGLSPTATSQPAIAPAPKGILDPSTGRPVGANDPFFLEVNSELSDKGFFTAATDDLIPLDRAGPQGHSGSVDRSTCRAQRSVLPRGQFRAVGQGLLHGRDRRPHHL